MLRSHSSRASTTLVTVAAALMALGTVMVFSATATLEGPTVLQQGWRHPAVRQGLFTGAALLVVLVVGMIPYEWWRIRRGAWLQPAAALALLAIGLCAVVLLPIPGVSIERNGARRWLALGPAAAGLSFQPSELAKLALVTFLAAYCAWRGAEIRRFWRGLLPALLVLGIVAGLVGKEDFGTAALLALVGAGLLLAAGARVWHLVLAGLPGVAGLAALILASPYRRARLLSYHDIWSDAAGKGYQQVQSLLTIASGGLWGLGLGGGVQKYGYLPEDHSDFIFAVICEELGLIGGVAVIAMFLVFLWQGRRAMLNAVDPLGRMLACGATLVIGLQAAINLAVVTASAPAKGISLPLVSAGGSGVIILAALIGVLVNVARQRDVSELDVDAA